MNAACVEVRLAAHHPTVLVSNKAQATRTNPLRAEAACRSEDLLLKRRCRIACDRLVVNFAQTSFHKRAHAFVIGIPAACTARVVRELEQN